MYSHDCYPPLGGAHVLYDMSERHADQKDGRSDGNGADEPYQQADSADETDDYFQKGCYCETTLQLKANRTINTDTKRSKWST